LVIFLALIFEFGINVYSHFAAKLDFCCYCTQYRWKYGIFCE